MVKSVAYNFGIVINSPNGFITSVAKQVKYVWTKIVQVHCSRYLMHVIVSRVLWRPLKSPHIFIYCSYFSNPQGLFAITFPYPCPLISNVAVPQAIYYYVRVYMVYSNIGT